MGHSYLRWDVLRASPHKRDRRATLSQSEQSLQAGDWLRLAQSRAPCVCPSYVDSLLPAERRWDVLGPTRRYHSVSRRLVGRYSATLLRDFSIFRSLRRSTSLSSIAMKDQQMEELFRAICSRNIQKIRSLPITKVTFRKKNVKGLTPLLVAASTLGPVYAEVYNTKKRLYAANLGDGEQMSTLHFACLARDGNFVNNLLIARGADVNERIPESCPLLPGYTPLHLCIELEFVDIARMLLDQGADVSISTPYGLTPIFMAEDKYLFDLTSTMLGKYTDWTVNPVHKKYGENYLHLACKYGLVDVVEALLHHGADVNKQTDLSGYTPLHLTRDASVVKVLLRYGANLGIIDHYNNSPLHKAFGGASDEVIALMLEGHGQCPVNPVDRKGYSHLHIACRKGSVVAIKNILEHCVVDINAPTSADRFAMCGYTPLHVAVKWGFTEVVQLLLDHGASPEVRDGWDLTPLHMAIRELRDDTTIAKLLLNAGAKVNVKHRCDLSPLQMAVQNLKTNHVALLLEHGADPKEKIEDRLSTLLHVCATAKNFVKHNRYPDIIRLLVEAGADLEAHNSFKERPIDLASYNKDDRSLRAFLFYGADIYLDRSKIEKPINIRISRIYSVEAVLEHLELIRHTNPSNSTSDDSVLNELIHDVGIRTENEVIHIRNTCRKEIEDLKEMGLVMCLTNSNAFMNNAIEVDRLWRRSEKLVELVESNELHRFPVYGDRLRLWYDDMQRMPACLDQALLVVWNHWNLNQDSAEAIFRYLNAKELDTLVKAFDL